MSRQSRTPDGGSHATHVAFLLAQLDGLLQVPRGHIFSFDRKHELTWYRGGPSSWLSAFVQRQPSMPADSEQVHAEVRVFLDRPRATVWLERGPRLVGKARSLLGKAAVHLVADSYEDLVGSIAALINRHLGE